MKCTFLLQKQEKELEKKSLLEKMQPECTSLDQKLAPGRISSSIPLDSFPRHNGYQYMDPNDMNKVFVQSDLNGRSGETLECCIIENDLLYNQNQKREENYHQKNLTSIFEKSNQEKEGINQDYNHIDEQLMNSEKTYTDDTESTNSFGIDKDRFW